jgi:hypothetical protein
MEPDVDYSLYLATDRGLMSAPAVEAASGELKGLFLRRKE